MLKVSVLSFVVLGAIVSHCPLWNLEYGGLVSSLGLQRCWFSARKSFKDGMVQKTTSHCLLNNLLLFLLFFLLFFENVSGGNILELGKSFKGDGRKPGCSLMCALRPLK